ncbi:MAG: hypothetical protein JWQ16_1404 [Novosphingobium sp.]|nr:hypothetical protein [Novosphingobium sp.]
MLKLIIADPGRSPHLVSGAAAAAGKRPAFRASAKG